MKKNLFLLVGLLVSLTSFAQQALNWSGIRGSVLEKTIPLSPSWSGTASVKAYTEPGGRLISSLLQPVVSRQDTILFVSFPNPAGLSNNTYVTISTGEVLRYAGYVTLGYTIPPIISNPGSVTPISTIITPGMVQGLNALLAAKLDADIQAQRDQSQDNTISGKVNGSDYTTDKTNMMLSISQKASLSDLAQRVVHVADIASLTTTPGSVSQTIHVRGARGGDFSFTSGTPNGGTTFQAPGGGVWKRDPVGAENIVYPAQFGAKGDSTLETPDALQAALDYAATLGQATVQLQPRYLLSSKNYSGTTTLLRIQPNVKLQGAAAGTIIKAAPNSFTAVNTNTNFLAYNIGRGAVYPNYNQNIQIENVVFDANGANQPANVIFGVVIQRALNTTLRNVTVKNTPGTGSGPGSGIESFGILLNTCFGATLDNCKAIADTSFASASGIGDNQSTDINYINCEAKGVRAMGFSSYYTANVRYADCNAFFVATNGFNEEFCFDVNYNRCVAGVSTNKALLDGFEVLGSPVPLNQKRARVNNPWGKAAGFRLLNTLGGDNITLTNCVAQNYADGTSNAGVMITGVPDQMTVTAVNGATVTVGTSVLTPFHVGRRVFVFGQYYQIIQIVSPTVMVLHQTTNAPIGQVLTMGGANINIQGGDFTGNDMNILFQESSPGLNKYSSRMVRISKDTKINPSARSDAKWYGLYNVGPQSKISVGFDIPVDAYSSTFTGSNQPGISASGNRVFNDFPYDCRVYLTGGTNVVASVNPGLYATQTAFGAFTSGSSFVVPARGFVILNYDGSPASPPTWQWWAN